jgi:aryl-alcohol dehydrogenase-like predicted oxidoreductase
MEYRKLGNTGIMIAEIGIGCEGFVEDGGANVMALIDAAEKNGVNYIDLYMPNPEMRSRVGEALRGRRDKFVLQAHMCTVWKDGQYERTRDIEEVMASFEDLRMRLGTPSVEVGMIHYVDSVEDWRAVKDGR